MFRIKIAGLVIGIDNRYEYVAWLCKRYLVAAEKEDFQVAAKKEEIIKEHLEGKGRFPLPYCEAACLYRRICQNLIGYDAFLMHSAALEMNGWAYIFAAKSGVGKTTHLKLWMEEFGKQVQVINGDKPVFRFLEGTLYVCGTPWCGKEGLGNPIIAPVKAICFLEQDQKNKIRRLEAPEVIGRIFHQMLMPKEEEAMNRFLDMVDRILADVDCYLLTCNRDREAALVAYRGCADSKNRRQRR